MSPIPENLTVHIQHDGEHVLTVAHMPITEHMPDKAAVMAAIAEREAAYLHDRKEHH